MKKELNTVDLFCGAGGASTGMELALERLGLVHHGLAINHWRVAVDTMRVNHPMIDTMEMKIQDAVPSELVPSRVVDLLWASPTCTHFSRARGGKPKDKQLRAQPELVITWLDQLFVRRFIIENVPEFVQWGPLGDDMKPLKSGVKLMDARDVGGVKAGKVKVGKCFAAWIESIKARNYKVEWKIVNCADYGDATSRKRFFLKGVRRGCGKIRWPEPTHAKDPAASLLTWPLKKWRGIRECLDMEDLGKSIFGRKTPLAANTLRRIAVGLRKYNGIDFQMDMLGADKGDESRVRPLTEPLPPQHAGGNRSAVVRPFIVRLNRNCTTESVDGPLSTVTTSGNHHVLCQPLVVDHFRNGKATDGSEPIGAQTTHERYSVVTPFIVRSNRGCYAESVDAPLSSQQAHTVHHAVCTPVVVDMSHPGDPNDERRVASGDEPLKTVTTRNNLAIGTPVIIAQQGGADVSSDKPVPTITTQCRIRVATPVIVDMSRPSGNDSGHIGSADDPIRTITTFDNVQVAIPLIFDKAVGLPRLPDGRYLDIRLRMLKPSELAAAHSFPKGYKLTGNRTEQVKQIGNSVPVRTAEAMCRADLEAA